MSVVWRSIQPFEVRLPSFVIPLNFPLNSTGEWTDGKRILKRLHLQIHVSQLKVGRGPFGPVVFKIEGPFLDL